MKKSIEKLLDFLQDINNVVTVLTELKENRYIKDGSIKLSHVFVVLCRSREILREIQNSNVKSLKDFQVSKSKAYSSDKRNSEFTIIFFGKNSDKCICYREEYLSLNIQIRTITKVGHAVKSYSINMHDLYFLESYIGDLIEGFHKKRTQNGEMYAYLWIIYELLTFYHVYTIIKLLFSYMFQVAKLLLT